MTHIYVLNPLCRFIHTTQYTLIRPKAIELSWFFLLFVLQLPLHGIHSVLRWTKGSSLYDLSVIRAPPFPAAGSHTCNEMLPGEGDFMDLPNTLPRKSNFLQRGKGYSWIIYRVKIKLEKKPQWHIRVNPLFSSFPLVYKMHMCLSNETKQSVPWKDSSTSSLFHCHTFHFFISLIRLLQKAQRIL